jgi:putative hydrolase of the HAD superfamily
MGEDLQSVQAVTFDVGGTLIDPWPSVGHVYAAVAEECGLAKFDPEFLNAQFAAAWRAKQNFEYTPEGWAEIVSQTFGKATRIDASSCLFRTLYERFAQANAWHVFDDVRTTLAELKSRGLRLAVISNWDDRLRPLLRNLALDQCFDALVVSAEAGLHKPARKIFQKTASLLGVPCSRVLHVGDSLREDVVGARGAGMKALLLRRGGGKVEGEVLGSLSELPHRIG